MGMAGGGRGAAARAKVSLRGAAALLAALLLAACGGGSGAGDAGADDGIDAGSDAGTDAGIDPGSDPGIDAGPDAPGDAAADDGTAADGPGDEGAAPDPIPGDVDPDALVLAAGDAPPEVALPDGVPLRVATLNVYGFRFATPGQVGAWLGARGADVVMLQEIAPERVAEVAAAAGFAHFAAGSGGKGMLSRTPLQDVADVPLVQDRGLLHATSVVGGVTFSLYCAHVSWNVAGNLQARQIAREVIPADPVPHLVMAGDFNDEHYSTQNAYLEEVLADAATVLGWYPGQHVTWPSTGFDETEGAQTIDLVFFRRSLPALVTAVAAWNLSPVLSDHKPVVADLWFPPGDAPFATDPLAPSRDPFAGFPAADALPPNLLANPGAEDGLAGWEAAGDAQAAASRLHLAPRTGGGLFTGFDAPRDLEAPWSWASQVADLSAHAAAIDAGRGRLYASAWLASGSRTVRQDDEVSNLLATYSDGEVVVEALDAAGAVLSRTPSGRRDTLAWHPFAAVVDLPPGTRAARATWLAHFKPHGGDLLGAAFDDLYLGFGDAGTPHGTAGGTLLAGGDGEPGAGDAPVLPPGWAPLRDGQVVGPWGIALFPPGCASGRGCFVAHPRLDPEAEPVEGPAALSFEADLSAHAADVDAGRLALRWGGWLRTYNALASARLALVVLQADGTPWATFQAPALAAAEWTRVVQRTRMPPKARRVRLEVRAPLDRDDDTVFADELSLVPERVAPGTTTDARTLDPTGSSSPLPEAGIPSSAAGPGEGPWPPIDAPSPSP